MNITVYCGAQTGKDPEFRKRAAELGTWMAENGHALVYGAGDVGMMGVISNAVMEAGGEVHLGIVHVGTVLQQGDADTRGKLAGQRLLGQRRTGNLLSLLSDKQAESILRGTYLATEVVSLRLDGQIGSLGTLYADRAHASQLMLQLHHIPRLLGHLAHLLDEAQLLVEHQQRVVGIGNAADHLGTDCHLVVLVA